MRINEIVSVLDLMHQARQPIYLEGLPGIGKSAIFKQFAEEKKIQFIDVRLAYFDPVDMRGLPFPKDGKTTWLTPDWLPTKGEGILLLDEFSAAPQAMQTAAYQLTLDRKIGDYILPDGFSVHLAGNGQGDRAIANALSSAIVSRVAKYELDVNLDDFCEYANDKALAFEIVAYLRFKPGMLHNFAPKTWKQGEPYSCPRTWEKLAHVLAICGTKKASLAMMAGIVGNQAATEFFSFMQLMHKLPNIDQILLDPKKTPVPEDSGGALFAISAALARRAKADNIDKVLIYTERMPKEFQVYCIRDALRCNKDPKEAITQSQVFTNWAIKNSNVLAI